MDFFVFWFLPFLPTVFLGAVFLLAVLMYWFRGAGGLAKIKTLVAGAAGFRVLYAVLLTAGQYYIWSQNEFTKLLLQSPLKEEGFLFNNKAGYFLFYSYGRFWLNVLLSIGAAFIFYLFLKLLKKHRERFFEDGEAEIGFLAALIAGWPNFAVFLPLVFISVVLMSVYRRIFMKEEYTTLGWPFLLAVLAVLVFGEKIIQVFSLGALKI